MPEGRYVDLLPMTTGTSMPPATARYARMPSCMFRKLSSLSFATSTGCQRGSGAPFSVPVRSPPVTAIRASRRKRAVGPNTVISRHAAPWSLPTSRLAARSANSSIAPDTGTPKRW